MSERRSCDIEVAPVTTPPGSLCALTYREGLVTDWDYHEDVEIDAEIRAEALESERIDLVAGYPPRYWRCTCGRGHSRGHFQAIGIHRCLGCGYVGDRGTTHVHTPDGRLVA